VLIAKKRQEFSRQTVSTHPVGSREIQVISDCLDCMHFLLATLLILLAALVVSAAAQFIALSISKIPINDVNLFYGRPLTEVRIAETTWRLGWIPVGGSIGYDFNIFVKMPLLTRLAVCLVGPMTLVAIGAMILGIHRATHSFLVGVPQYFAGAFHPHGYGIELISKLESVFSISLSAAIATVILKFASINLLLLAGACFREIVGPRIKLTVADIIITLTTLATLLAGSLWAIAICIHLFKK
jgi:hypothetical protein